MRALLTKADLSKILSVSPRTINYWVQQGRFPKPLRINGDRLARWRPADIDDWLDGQPRG